MPIWLRNFTFSTLKEHYDKQNTTNTKSSKPLSPDIKPSYNTKASK